MADLAIKSKAEIFELIKRAAQELYPDADWTGLRTGTFEWLLAQIVAEASILNGEYLELRANNAYLESANVRKDVRDIASNLGLFPNERAGATVSLDIVATNDVTIPKGSQLSSTNGEIFSTLNELSLTTSTSLSGSVLAVHADYEAISYRARGDSQEVIPLNKDDVLLDRVTVSVDSEEWERVNNLFGQISSSKVYRVVFDERNRASIKFGDGIYGKRLPADAQVVIDVYSGGGPAGNSVAAGAITSFISSFTNSSNIDSVTNVLSPSGGDAQDSLAEITEQLPGQLRQIAGLVNPEDIAQVIKANLTFVADANAQRGHTVINNVYVPTVTISAYPNNDAVEALSSAQNTELAAFLAARGELGVIFSAQDAYAAPVEMELEVRLGNNNLQAQKRAEIKAALNSNSDAPFTFSNLRFNNQYKLQTMLNIVENVDGVLFARMKRFARKPHALSVAGFEAAANGFADIELGSTAEDGYFQFRATDSDAADVSFFRPFLTTSVGADYIESSEVNYLVEEHLFADGSVLDDTNGPYIKPNGSDKLEIKQFTRVWENDQWNGGVLDYTKKYLLRVQYVDSNGNTKTAYYHIDDTYIPDTLSTVEDADSPIAGTPILATLADEDNTNISVQIIEDQESGSTLVTPQGQIIDVTHNDKNKIYLASDPSGVVPIGQYSYVHFNEVSADLTGDSWIANTSALRIRFYVSEPFSVGDLVEVYTTPQVADRLFYKHPREVFVLSASDIKITFI